MTTALTTQTIPSTTPGFRRVVVGFVAGALLAGAAASGITASLAHESSPVKATTSHVVSVSPSADQCHMGSPC